MFAWLILALVTVAHALGALAALVVAPLSPFLLDALALSRAQVGLLLPAVYLGGVMMSLPAGWITDRLGVRATLALGLLVVGAAVLAAAFARGLAPLLGCLVVAGFGFSVLNPSTGRAVIDWFPARRRGVAMGIKQTGLTLGGLAGALLAPPLADASGWPDALAAAGTVSICGAIVVALAYRRPALRRGSAPPERARLAEIRAYLRRPGVLIVLACGFALSIAQASVLAYLALFVRDTLAVSAVTAGQFLALAQAGGTASRLAWGVASDRFFGGRRRPGVVANAALSVAVYALFALGDALPIGLVIPLTVVAGAAAFGWVGLYFALVAEIGGARHAGLLTGVAVAFAWSGVLVGPPIFGLALDRTGTYAAPWLLLSTIAAAVALTLPRPKPLVERDAV